MSKRDKEITYAFIGVIVVGYVAYSIGLSAGKTSAPVQEHTDSEYTAVKACYIHVSSQMEHINTIITYLGSEPSYETLANAVKQIGSYDEKVIALAPSDGGYSCP